MFKQKISIYIKLISAILIAFLIGGFLIKEVFLAGTPKINPYAWNNITSKVKTSTSKFIALFKPKPSQNITNQNVARQNNPTVEFLKNNLKPITKGVSAASKDNYSYTVYKLNEVEWMKISYTLKNGETINVEYPKGTNPPPKSIFERN